MISSVPMRRCQEEMGKSKDQVSGQLNEFGKREVQFLYINEIAKASPLVI